MSTKTFDKTVEWVKYFVERRTQTEINLFGIGEPTMNANLPLFVKKLRDAIPLCIHLHSNTNGGLMTEEMAISLKDAGIDQIDITGHNHLFTARTMRLFRRLNIKSNLTYDFVIVPNNWAGQVNWFKSEINYVCPWLSRGQLFVAWNGDLLQCCFDAKANNVLGNIFDNDPSDIDIKPYELCKTCHQDIPKKGE
jgi:sulfatase maturation enzyme AslB (radical SAM superfamily)